MFVADPSQRVCHSTVRSYLSAVRHLHLSQGLPDHGDFNKAGTGTEGAEAEKSKVPGPQAPYHTIGAVHPRKSTNAAIRPVRTPHNLGSMLPGFLCSGEFTLATGEAFDLARHLTTTPTPRPHYVFTSRHLRPTPQEGASTCLLAALTISCAQ